MLMFICDSLTSNRSRSTTSPSTASTSRWCPRSQRCTPVLSASTFFLVLSSPGKRSPRKRSRLPAGTRTFLSSSSRFPMGSTRKSVARAPSSPAVRSVRVPALPCVGVPCLTDVFATNRAYRDRPCASPEPEGAPARRSDVCARFELREGRARSVGSGREGPHHDRDCTPSLDDPERELHVRPLHLRTSTLHVGC